MGESQETGHFVRNGHRSPAIRCMDVLDSFPCLTCRAGLDGNNLACRNHGQREADQDAYFAWNADVSRKEFDQLVRDLKGLEVDTPHDR